MNTPINRQTLLPIQRNAIIAEKVMGWQWIPFDFDDVSMKDQLWLLPDALATHNITNGEWTWCVEEEEIWPEGSISPLEHKDNHILPTWIPNYTASMDAAMSVLRAVVKLETCNHDVLSEELWDTVNGDIWPPTHATKMVCDWMPEKICLAALKAVSCEVQS